MNDTHRETLIACLINTAFSVFFYFIAFYGSTEIVLGWGSKFSLDFLPQTFFVSLFSVLPSTLITQRRLRKQPIAEPEQYFNSQLHPLLPSSTVKRIVILTLVSWLVFASVTQLFCAAFASLTLSFNTGLILKIAVSCIVTLVVVPLSIRSTQFWHKRLFNQDSIAS